MDPLTAAATIIQVADFGLSVVSEIYRYIDLYITAEQRLERVAKHVELTSDLLQNVGDLFRDRAIERIMTESVKRTAVSTAKECESILKELLEIVDKARYALAVLRAPIG